MTSAAILRDDTLGERVRKCRERLDETREDLAEAVGREPGTIGRYERDERQIPSETLRKLALHFGVSADYLLGLRATPPFPSGKSKLTAIEGKGLGPTGDGRIPLVAAVK